MHLPHDVWLHIAQFIPVMVLPGLLSLNSTFYDIAMDCRYRQMSFTFFDEKMLRNLVRLKDPVVARRVRVLHVYPGFLKQVLNHERESPSARRSLRLRLAELANHVLEQKIFVKHNKFRFVETTFRTAGEVVNLMLDVFGGLPNVTDYHITWYGLHAVPESPVPFLAAIFRSNLRKLSLEVSLDNVGSLFSHPSPLRNLEELDLVIRIDHVRFASGYDVIIITHLAPAITRLRSSLRKLTIQTWEPLDLSSLFYTIGYLPILEHLTIAVPIEAPHLGCPAGLASFLNQQSTTLRSLSLRATQYSGAGLTPDSTLIDEWVKKALRSVHLHNLRELDISSSLFPLRTSIACLKQFAATITSLTITGCYHTHADIVTILDEFSHRLTRDRLESLRLGSVILTPQLIDLLEERLPGLYRLELLVRGVLPVSPYPDCNQIDTDGQLDHFSSDMEERRYSDWNLRHLTFRLTSFPDGSMYGSQLEQLFARCIPSICGRTR